MLAPAKVKPTLQEKFRESVNDATDVLEMAPFAGADRAGQVVTAQATADQVPLLWQVLTPPPQYPAEVLQLRLLVLR